VGPGRISRSVTAKGPGQAMPTSLLEHHEHFLSLRVEVVVMADHARHRTFQQDQRQFQQRSVTPPGPVRRRRRGCYVCGALGCHTVILERNGTLPSNFRRAPPTGNNDRNRGNCNNNSRLNANARVFTPSSNGRHQPPSGNSGGNPASGNRVPPLQRPSSA